MKNKICKISLFSAILACVSAMPADCAVKTNNSNRSYADAYNQVNALRYQQEYLNATATNATTTSATANLPVMVSDEKLASAILNNNSETTVAHLENCAMIYPNGVFRWEIPESGIRRNQTNQCVSVISLIDATTNTVLATTTVAAGDAIKCNIDSFPESGMNAIALNKIELPADAAPTMEDVEAVMNEEQKQNAGFKIAAGAIISGVAGNLLAPKEAGDTKMFGTGKSQLIGTAAGAATGAGIMAASSYSGKVAGDTIKSTAVNAASGMIVGNMLAGASGENGILVVKKCAIEKTLPEFNSGEGETSIHYPSISAGEHDCVVGKIAKQGAKLTIDENKLYLVNERGSVKECTKNSDSTYDCNDGPNLLSVSLKYNTSAEKPFEEIFGLDKKNTEVQFLTRYVSDESNPTVFKRVESLTENADFAYYEISSAYLVEGSTQHAYLVFESNIGSKFGGYKTAEIKQVMNANPSFVYMYRNANGTPGVQITNIKKEDVYFTPSSGSASDGGLVDLSNQARTKGTLVGTAAGGAMGGFAGYQGAKSEITDRWTSAVREYEDSLSNFVCMTGTRYLSKYNDYVEIPEMQKVNQ